MTNHGGGGGTPVSPTPGPTDFTVETASLDRYVPILEGLAADWTTYVTNPVSTLTLADADFGLPGEMAHLVNAYNAGRQHFLTMDRDASAAFLNAANTLKVVAENYGDADIANAKALGVVGQTLPAN